MTAAERVARAMKGGNATKAKYGRAYYREISKKSSKPGAPRIPSLAESLETAAGRKAMAEVAASYGVRQGAPATGRGGRQPSPAPSSGGKR